LAVVVLVVRELVLALGPELVLEFAPVNQDSRQCFDYCLIFLTSFGGLLHLASSMQLAVVVFGVRELVLELVLVLGPELVLEFAPVKLGLSQFDLQSLLGIINLIIQKETIYATKEMSQR
nr:hypothetical protein [Tanacetum cinerariifolium]